MKATAKSAAERAEALERSGAADVVEFREMRADILRVESKVDKMVWAIVGLALTIASTAVGIAVTVGAHP